MATRSSASVSFRFAFPTGSATVCVSYDGEQIIRRLLSLYHCQRRAATGIGARPPDVSIDVEFNGTACYVRTPSTIYRLNSVGGDMIVEYEILGNAITPTRHRYRRTYEGICPTTDPTIPHLSGILERIMLATLCEHNSLDCYHAAGLTRGDRGVLIVGESQTGKTTIALSLLSQDWKLLSDDTTFINPADGYMFPTKRRPAIRDLRPCGFSLEPYLETMQETVPSSATAYRVRSEFRNKRPAAVTDIVFLDGMGGTFLMQRYSPTSALIRLAQASFSSRATPVSCLCQLTQCFQSARWWTCQLSDPASAAAYLTQQLLTGLSR